MQHYHAFRTPIGVFGLVVLFLLFSSIWTSYVPPSMPQRSAQAQGNLTAGPTAKPGFPVTLGGAPVRYSPIALGTINEDDIVDIVVGGSDGIVYAYTGNGQRLWAYDTGDKAIEGKAAIGDIDLDGHNEVVIGAGSPFPPNAVHGGLYVLDHTGNLQCSFAPGDFNNDGFQDSVYSSPALVDLDGSDEGRLEIVFGSYDGRVYALHDDCSVFWKNYVRDTVWSSPAIADLDQDGLPEVIIGVDSHDEPTFGTEDGGRLHVYRADGQSELAGFPIQIDEVIYSSPAVGDIDGDNDLEIMVGTGTCWSDPACAPGGRVNPNAGRYMNAWHHTGQPVAGWPRAMEHNAFASPALADVDSDEMAEVIVNTQDGWVHAFNHDASYVSGWPVKPLVPADADGNSVSRSTNASPIVADLDGNGAPEVVLPSNWELVVWNTSGQQITRKAIPSQPDTWALRTQYSVNSTAAVGDIDGDGLLELLAAGGLSGGTTGAIYAWDLTTSAENNTLPWPSFRRNRMNHALLQTPKLAVSTEQLSFLLLAGEQRSHVLTLSDTAGGSLEWTASADQSWIELGQTSGTTPDSLQITANTQNLSVGNHTGTVMFTWGTTELPVTVRVYVADNIQRMYVPLVVESQ